MTQISKLIGLHAQTSIHAGTGQNTGVIDLPIQREGHNGWPCIFGSAVKGALRSRAEEKYDKDSGSVIYVFGETTEKGNEQAGAIAISDARLLLLPVRSLTSQFKWVTCPAVLQRLAQDASRFASHVLTVNDLSVLDENLGEEQAFVDNSHSENEKLFLEEYRFQAKPIALEVIIEAILPFMNGVSKATLAEQLVIVSNDNFTYIAEHATPVNAHIAIESETKVVKQGALWYEETLPPETILYIGLSAVKSRHKREKGKEDIGISAERVMGAITDLFSERAWLQLGGNETVGMGWCAVSILDKSA